VRLNPGGEAVKVNQHLATDPHDSAGAAQAIAG
jgi:hypothetical protein